MTAFVVTVKMLKDVKLAVWTTLALYMALLFFVYQSSLQQLVLHDWNKEDYSYCWLIPFVVVYLIWEKRRELSLVSSTSSVIGLAVVALGVFFFWLGELGGEYYTLCVSLWLVIVGLFWMHLGWQKIKTVWFTLVVLLAAFPFPNVINFPLALRLRLISSEIGVKMLQLAGISAYREGNVIDLGFTQLQVVDACSGLRYLFPLMIIALLLAYWMNDGSRGDRFDRRTAPPSAGLGRGGKEEWEGRGEKGPLLRHWKRAVLFLSSIPVAIIVNALRIAITGALYPIMGARAAEGFFHDFSGWLIFMFTIPILLVEMWVLRFLPPRTLRQ